MAVIGGGEGGEEAGRFSGKIGRGKMVGNGCVSRGGEGECVVVIGVECAWKA